jgi:release factor glutamine methyltransferase
LTLRQHLDAARKQLAGLAEPQLEAEILLAWSMDVARTYLWANPESELAASKQARFRELLERRLKGEPIAYITGQREFWSLPLRVTKDVLIPRHETELLVEAALQCIPEDAAWRIADLGTGSGAVALAIASERAHCEIHASDNSGAALDVARENARSLGFKSVVFHEGSWCEPLDGRFQLIVSNPPYVARGDVHLQQGDARFEPRHALTPGADPFRAIRLIADQCRAVLRSPAWLLLEHGTGQGSGVREILGANDFGKVETIKDLAGHDRVTLGQFSN